MRKSIFLLRFVFVLASLISSIAADAQSVENVLWLNTITGGTNNHKTAQEAYGLTGASGFTDAIVRDYVKVFIDHGQNEYISGNPTYKVNITIRKYTDATTYTTIGPMDLTLTYSADNSAVYTDISEYTFDGNYKIRAQVNSVKDAAGTTYAWSALPFSLGMAVGIEIDRYLDFDPADIPPAFQISYDQDAYSDNYRYLEIKNYYIEGAYAYDIEWSYSNNYSNTDLATSLMGSNVEYWFHNNSTRIRVYSDDPIVIPAVFDKGYVIARVRGIGKDPTDLTKDVYGVWSLEDHYDDQLFYKKHISDITDGDYYVVIGSAAEKPVHESNKNWMFQTTYAEEGKMKHTISYYDGTLRNRQTVTVVNSNEEAFITETFYDHQGRAAVQSLPGPAPLNLSDHFNKEVKYYENYNLAEDGNPATTNEKYGRSYFDVDDAMGDPCDPYLTPFDVTSGVGQYYSTNNPKKGSLNAFIPDGEGYTFVLTEYTPDNTGRINRQSGVGPDHHLNTDHITSYYYAAPEQWELDRLFGNQIGVNSHYQKNAIVDPNGQVSVSYLDLRGNVIATALAGPIPENLMGVSYDGDITNEYENSQITATIDLLGMSTDYPHGDMNELVDGGLAWEVSKEILVTGESENTFSYTAEDLDYEELCLNEKCLDCVYDIHISLKDKCGTERLNDGDGISFTIGDIPMPDGSATSLTCGDYGYEWSETITLETGTYSLTKTITLNEEALHIYADLYIDYLQTENESSCIQTLDDFEANLESLTALSCEFSCEECTAITDLEDFITAFPDIDFDDYAEGTAEEMFLAFKSQCDLLCPRTSNNYCEAGYTMMLADMRPNGQYAEYRDIATGAIDVGDFPLSIFNDGNLLQEREFVGASPNLPDWKHPISYFDDEWHQGYFDLDNNAAVVEVELIDLVAGLFDPSVVDDELVDFVDGKYWTAPDNLENVEDFIAYYAGHPEWAKSLVAYHPEFYYYSYCSLGFECTATIDGTIMNTYDFEAFLLGLPYDDPDVADYDALQLLSDIAGTPSEAIANLVEMDPLFIAPTCFDFTGMPNTTYYDINATEFENILANYDNCHVETPVTYYTIWEMVNNIQNVGTVLEALPVDCYVPTTTPDEVGIAVIDNESDWITFINLYIAAKQKYLNTNAHMFALAAFDNATPANDFNYYSGCIGNTEYDVYWETDATTFASFAELINNNCLCNLSRIPALSQKQQRYPNVSTAYEISPDASDAELIDASEELVAEGDYAYYYETGKGNKPLAIDITNLLNGLLAKTAWIDYDITDFDALEGISTRLFDNLTLPSPDGLDIDELLPTVSGAGSNVLTWADGANILLVTITGDDDALNDYDWTYDDEKFIAWNNMLVTNDATGEFTIDLQVISPESTVRTIHLTGVTAIKVDDAAFLDDAITCDLNPEMNSIFQLVNYLKETEHFEVVWPSEYELSTDEAAMIKPALEPYLGPGPYKWVHNTGLYSQPYVLGNSDYTKYVSICFSSLVESSDYIHDLDPFGPDGYTGVVNSFIGMGVTGGYETPVSGYVKWNNFYLDEEEPFAVGDCEYPVNDPCNDEEVYNAIDLLAFLQTLVSGDDLTTDYDITAIPEYTPRLKMLTGYDGTGTVIWDVNYAADSKMLDAEFDFGGTDEYCYVSLNMDDPAITFSLADIVSVDNLIADYTYAVSDVAYYFTLDAHFTGGLTYTIHGFTSCIPLKNCFCGTIPAGFTACNDNASLDLRVDSGTPFVKRALEFIDGDEEAEIYPTTDNLFTGALESVTWIIETCTGVYTIYNPGDESIPYYLLPMEYDGTIVPVASFTCDYSDEQNPIAYLTLGEEVVPLDPLDPAGLPDDGTLEAICEPPVFEPFPTVEPGSDCEGLIATLVDNAAQYAYDEYISDLKDAFIAAYSTHCMSNLIETFDRTYTSSEYHYTLYYYDQVNNLAMTVPPSGVDVLEGTDLDNVVLYRNGAIVSPTLPEHTYKTQYHYNSLNQLIWQETPDAGVSQFWYDRLGRLVLSQNQKQNNPYVDFDVPTLYYEKYSYTDFDELGRITEVGELYADEDIELDGSFTTYINDEAFPSTIAAYKLDVTRTFYTTAYSFATSPFGTDGQENLRNRVAYTTIEDFDDADDDTYQYATHYSYDIHGNVDRLVQENPGLDDFGDNNRFKLIEYEYDLISGNVNKVHYQSGKEDQFHHKYYYDADNRLLAVFTSRDNHIWDKDARYFYYRHGPLARTEIGDLKVQGVDYAYTIHGWLKGVNATALNTAKDMGKDAKYAGPLSSSNSYVGSDAFGFVLDYYKGDYNRINTSAPDFVATQQSGGTYYTYYDPSNSTAPDLWNGNIRGMSTALMDPDHVKVDVLGKSYQYDQLNRIKKSYSFEKASMDIAANFTWVGVSASNNWNTEYTYDPNGNITTMKRSGNANTAFDMDQFTYHYYQGTENSNRLKYVSDAATGTYSEDIDDQTGAAIDNKNYEYDEIGNLTKDVTGDLEDIKWTVYGKIREIEKGDGTILTFAYDPMGQRIMKKVDPTSGNTVYTYYLRDAQGNNMATYERIDAETTDELFLTEQYVYGSSRVGYVSLNYEMVDATPSTTNFVRKLGEKRYELSNHLGNVLAVVTDRLFAYQEASPYTNHVKYYETDVIAAQDYDPFGVILAGHNWVGGSENYRFGFNGKESSDEIYSDNATVDFGARIFDNRLGRWFSLDPYYKVYTSLSPYCGVGNNPILLIDINGESIYIGANRVLYTPGMSIPNDADCFTQQTIEALNFMFSNTYYDNQKKILFLTEYDDLSLTINEGQSDFYSPIGFYLSFNAESAVKIGDLFIPSVVALAHEVDHAYMHRVLHQAYVEALKESELLEERYQSGVISEAEYLEQRKPIDKSISEFYDFEAGSFQYEEEMRAVNGLEKATWEALDMEPRAEEDYGKAGQEYYKSEDIYSIEPLNESECDPACENKDR